MVWWGWCLVLAAGWLGAAVGVAVMCLVRSEAQDDLMDLAEAITEVPPRIHLVH